MHLDPVSGISSHTPPGRWWRLVDRIDVFRWRQMASIRSISTRWITPAIKEDVPDRVAAGGCAAADYLALGSVAKPAKRTGTARPVTVTLMPTDLASGPAATYYKIDSGSWISGTQFTVSQEGMHTTQFYTRDYAGNVEDVNDAGSINVDMVAPSPPYGLASSPQGWTSANSYTITWNSLVGCVWHRRRLLQAECRTDRRYGWRLSRSAPAA